MPFTQRQRLSQRLSKPLLATIVVGLLLGFAGPFGSYPAYPMATRYAFWMGLTAAGVATALAANAVLPVSRLRPDMVRIGAVAMVSAVPMTFVVAWTITLLQPGRVFTPLQLPALFGAVSAVQLLIAYAATAGPPKADYEGEAVAQAQATAALANEIPAALPSALLSRLPPDIGNDIRALETEDHYLRVHTAAGSALILMRMADAVALLDPALGAQVHRRWWVADAAVAGLGSERQKLFVRLVDGRSIPVGRTFAANTKARFALKPSPGPRGPVAP